MREREKCFKIVFLFPYFCIRVINSLILKSAFLIAPFMRAIKGNVLCTTRLLRMGIGLYPPFISGRRLQN